MTTIMLSGRGRGCRAGAGVVGSGLSGHGRGSRAGVVGPGPVSSGQGRGCCAWASVVGPVLLGRGCWAGVAGPCWLVCMSRCSAAFVLIEGRVKRKRLGLLFLKKKNGPVVPLVSAAYLGQAG